MRNICWRRIGNGVDNVWTGRMERIIIGVHRAVVRRHAEVSRPHLIKRRAYKDQPASYIGLCNFQHEALFSALPQRMRMCKMACVVRVLGCRDVRS